MGLREMSGVAGWFRRHPIALGIALAVAGLLIGVVGVLGITSTTEDSSRLRELRAGSGSTERGTLVGSKTVAQENAPNLPDRTRYCPRYAYTATDGVERTIVDYDGCENVESQLEDKTVSVIFDTDEPSVAFIDEDSSAVGRSSHKIFAWSMLALGTGLLVAAPFMAVRARRRLPARTDAAPRHL